MSSLYLLFIFVCICSSLFTYFFPVCVFVLCLFIDRLFVYLSFCLFVSLFMCCLIPLFLNISFYLIRLFLKFIYFLIPWFQYFCKILSVYFFICYTIFLSLFIYILSYPPVSSHIFHLIHTFLKFIYDLIPLLIYTFILFYPRYFKLINIGDS